MRFKFVRCGAVIIGVISKLGIVMLGTTRTLARNPPSTYADDVMNQIIPYLVLVTRAWDDRSLGVLQQTTLILMYMLS